ncbi:MAG: hypothetical protein OQK24_08415 [Magnetovibrio sp.]|nr:hypothetical protein [Magnetovibrio sp.]
MFVSRLPVIACVVLSLTLSSHVALAQSSQSQPSPQEQLEDAARMVLGTLKMIMSSIPQYEAPVILENGDILIRRKPKPQSPNGVGDNSTDQDRI